ncbi:MAG: hypothetical protein ABIT08_17015 [Bacteroidia bacterium]
MKNPFCVKQFSLLLIFISCFHNSLIAQQNMLVTTNHTTLEFKILSSINQSADIKLENILQSYPGKILSYKIADDKKQVTINISDKTNPVDILQALNMQDIKACYLDADNNYITLEPDGRSTRKLYFKE